LLWKFPLLVRTFFAFFLYILFYNFFYKFLFYNLVIFISNSLAVKLTHTKCKEVENCIFKSASQHIKYLYNTLPSELDLRNCVIST
jgi:hypothetical protein